MSLPMFVVAKCFVVPQMQNVSWKSQTIHICLELRLINVCIYL